MKRLLVLLPFLLTGCVSTLQIPDIFVRQDIQTDSYTLVSWSKVTDASHSVRIYLEGDGHAFNFEGQPTNDPTPKGSFLRDIAFHDPNPNVVYLARPCQYVMSPCCTKKDWTTGRFSPAIVQATTQAIRTLSKGQDIILIGYSGGAMLSGLVITRAQDLPIQQWKTIAGLLNHTRWTQSAHLQPLKDSLDLKALPQIPQEHYFGGKDSVVDYRLYSGLVNSSDCHVVPNAKHDSGFETVMDRIYR